MTVRSSQHQQHYRHQIVSALQDAGFIDIVDRMSRCGAPEYRKNLGRHIRFECRMSFCPDCRYRRIVRRKDTYLPLFGDLPSEAVSCITLLFDIHDRLDTMTVIPTGTDGVLRTRVPMASLDLKRHRGAYGAFLRKLRDRSEIDGCLQAGAIEFELHSYSDMEAKTRSHRLAFIDACRDGAQPGDVTPTDIFVSHAHFLFAAKKGDRFLTHDEVRGLFTAQYLKPYQVKVTGLSRRNRDGQPMTNEDALAGWLQYAMKSFSDYPAERAVELARFDAAVNKKFYSFNRRIGSLRGEAIGAAVIDVDESPSPEPPSHRIEEANALVG